MQQSFNLLNAYTIMQQRWKTILAFAALAALAALITVFVVPKYYRSSATLVSANPRLADKARLFNNNIQELYSGFGSGDDLDRIYGIAQMDTVYKRLVDDFSLLKYYELQGDSLQILRRKAVRKLKKDLDFRRTEEGQLKIIAWTRNRQLSADLVNRMVALVTEIESNIWQNNYTQSLSHLTSAIADMEHQYQQLADSLAQMPAAKKELAIVKQQTLLEQLKQYQKSADEFKLAMQTQPQVLYVLEAATPAAIAERPAKLLIVVAAFVAGFFFAWLLLLSGYRRNHA